MSDFLIYTIFDPIIWTLVLLIILLCISLVVFYKKIKNRVLRNLIILILVFGFIVIIFDIVSIIQTYRMIFE